MKFTVLELKKAGVWERIMIAREIKEEDIDKYTDDTEIQIRTDDKVKIVFESDFLKNSTIRRH